jgi:predicted small integral membrane protein
VRPLVHHEFVLPTWLVVILYALIILLMATLVKWEFSRMIRNRRVSFSKNSPKR